MIIFVLLYHLLPKLLLHSIRIPSLDRAIVFANEGRTLYFFCMSYIADDLFRIMSTLVLACLLHYISFSSAFGLFPDEPSLFSTDVEALQNANFLDITTPDFVSDQTLNDEDPNEFDPFFNDPGLDLFASDDFDVAIPNSIDDPILLADCSSPNGKHPGKKARARRDAVCTNSAPGFNPTLSLPTLDQLSPLQATEDPFRPKTDREIEIQGWLDAATTIIGGIGLPHAQFLVRPCGQYYRVCSSGNKNDIHPGVFGDIYVLTKASPSEFFFCFVF